MNRLYITISIISVLLASCSIPKNSNKVVIDPDLKREILLGEINEKGLTNYSVFTNTENFYNNYNVDTALAKIIKANSKGIKIKVVFGSWCGDSKINVPAFKKIVDVSGFKKSNVEYIAVNRRKKGGDIDVSKLNINYVPTFIFYHKGKEIGRIIEYPDNGTIEQDWVEIVTGK
jgi:thiol-disulfide isomerase/thioredoxin